MRRLLGVLLIAAIAAVVVAVASGQDSSGGGSGSEPAPLGHVARSSSSHVVVIVMENKEEQDVVGTKDAPYLTGLARRYASVSRSYGVRHPSLPNYIALTSGSTHGITNDCEDCHVDARNIVDQLEAKHISWKAYMSGVIQANVGRRSRRKSGASSVNGTTLRQRLALVVMSS